MHIQIVHPVPGRSLPGATVHEEKGRGGAPLVLWSRASNSSSPAVSRSRAQRTSPQTLDFELHDSESFAHIWGRKSMKLRIKGDSLRLRVSKKTSRAPTGAMRTMRTPSQTQTPTRSPKSESLQSTSEAWPRTGLGGISKLKNNGPRHCEENRSDRSLGISHQADNKKNG
jgi:hypothetical protein